MTQAGDGSQLGTAGQGGDGGQQQQGQQQQSGSGGDGQGFSPITSQEEFDKRIQSRIERERSKYADYDDLKKRLGDMEDANKSELDKATEKANQAAKEATDRADENARLRAAIKHGLSEEDVAALDGVPADKVDALAERLAAGNKKTTRTSAAGLQSGAGNGNQQLTGKEKAAAALRDLRRQ